MKTIKKIFVFVTVFAAMLCLFSCVVESVNKFEVTSYPKTTYVLNEAFSWDGLEVSINGQAYSKAQAEKEGVEFPATIDTTKAGVYTITLNYDALKANFQYTVLDSYFANGTGTKENPYQVSTLVQLDKVLNDNDRSKVQYYELINDIDCAERDFANVGEAKNFVLDGQGYSLKNVKFALTKKLSGEVATFKNMNVYVATGGSTFFDLPGDATKTNNVAGLFTEANCAKVNTYEGISTFGLINIAGVSKFSLFGFVGEKANNNAVQDGTLIVNGCANYADIYATTVTGASVITGGSYNQDTANVALCYILGFKNYGNIFSQAAGLVYANYSYNNGFVWYVVDEATANYGKIVSTVYAGTNFAATRNSDAKAPFSLDRVSVYNFAKVGSILSYADFKAKKDSLELFANVEKSVGVVEPVEMAKPTMKSATDTEDIKPGITVIKIDGNGPETAVKFVVTVYAGTTVTYADGKQYSSKSSEQISEFGAKVFTSIAELNAAGLKFLQIANYAGEGVTKVNGLRYAESLEDANYIVHNVANSAYAGFYSHVNGAVTYSINAYNAAGQPLETLTISFSNK